MATSRSNMPSMLRRFNRSTRPVSHGLWRGISNDTTLGQLPIVPPKKSPRLPPLSVMPTNILVRSLLMTYVLSSPRLIRISIPIMDRISHSRSWFLHPDKNPLLHLAVRKLFYDHFCAGENEVEVKRTMKSMKKMGFGGVILGYAKETLDEKTRSLASASKTDAKELAIEQWKMGTLKTLSMLGDGDFLAVKFTGAGTSVTEALASGHSPPYLMKEAMSAICDQAATQKTRLWIDAEQQVFQHTIDDWTIDLMRTYNTSGSALVYMTPQAYLKGTLATIQKHLKLAQEEGWALGLKLVRGAYISTEPRHLIHNTIEDTHAAYDSIVEQLLTKTFPGPDPRKEYPIVQLMLASHNENSVKKGYEIWKCRNENGLPTIKLEIAQLQGMADEISCGLVQQRKEMISGETFGAGEGWHPRAFKCLCWGGTQECIQFLIRRAVENNGSLDRTKLWMKGLKKELWRRIRALIAARE